MSASLAGLKPKGLWRSPLSASQIEAAIEFGREYGEKGEVAIQDAFLVEYNHTLQATISISTAFERIAVYAAQQTARKEQTDSAFIETICHNPIFETHYTLDFISPHKLLSVMRFTGRLGADGNVKPIDYEKMGVVYRNRNGSKSHRQVVAFPYPYYLDGAEFFEVVVPKFFVFGTAMARFTVDLRLYH
jgi:hypothetical protein